LLSTPVPVPSVEPASLPEPPPPTGFRRIAAALTYRDFRVLWFGALTAADRATLRAALRRGA
jgi:hypothetical protein